MFDSATFTKIDSRFAGSWKEAKRDGLIVYNIDDVNFIEGDVVVPYGAGAYGHHTDAGVAQPRAVMVPGLAGKPMVVCIAGVTPVNINGAAGALLNDTLVSNSVTKTAKVDNTVTNPKLILGYIHKNVDTGDLAFVKVL